MSRKLIHKSDPAFWQRVKAEYQRRWRLWKNSTVSAGGLCEVVEDLAQDMSVYNFDRFTAQLRTHMPPRANEWGFWWTRRDERGLRARMRVVDKLIAGKLGQNMDALHETEWYHTVMEK
jgi:hypothetical protein